MRHNGQHHRRPEEIEAEIARTRTDLDETLSAIEQRLTPGQLVDQGLDYLRHSEATEYLKNLREATRRDPLPVALVGVGLAWLMLSGRRHQAPASHEHPSATDALKEKVSETTQKVSHAAQVARETAGRVGEGARHQAERLRGSYEHLVHEQPLALGAIGFALGALAAAAAPRTRVDERSEQGRHRAPASDAHHRPLGDGYEQETPRMAQERRAPSTDRARRDDGRVDEMGGDALRAQEMRNDAMRNDAMRNDAMRNEAMRNDAMRNEAMRNEAMRNEAMVNDALRQQQAMREEGAREASRAAAGRDALRPDGRRADSVPARAFGGDGARAPGSTAERPAFPPDVPPPGTHH